MWALGLTTLLALSLICISAFSLYMPDTEDRCDCRSNFHVIGHRGLSESAPENTLPAFVQAAQETGYLELDLARTLDKQLVAMHDEYVDRTTNGHGAISRMNYEVVKRLDAGEWFGPKYKGVGVPTLGEVFSALGDKTRYLIDIRAEQGPQGASKYDAAEALVAQFAAEVRQHGLESKVSVSTDDAKVVKLVKQALPESTVLAKVNIMYTLSPSSSIWELVDKSGADGISAHFLNVLLHSSLIAEAKQRGSLVFIYTVDSIYVSNWLECLGVDAILTNKPEKIATAAKCPIAGAYDP